VNPEIIFEWETMYSENIEIMQKVDALSKEKKAKIEDKILSPEEKARIRLPVNEQDISRVISYTDERF
jgi:hypothetical protein